MRLNLRKCHHSAFIKFLNKTAWMVSHKKVSNSFRSFTLLIISNHLTSHKKSVLTVARVATSSQRELSIRMRRETLTWIYRLPKGYRVASTTSYHSNIRENIRRVYKVPRSLRAMMIVTLMMIQRVVHFHSTKWWTLNLKLKYLGGHFQSSWIALRSAKMHLK